LPTIKELTNKLKNLQNTKKITAAMKMVAASKLRRAQEAIERTRPYRAELTKLLSDLQSAVAGEDLPEEAAVWLDPRPVKHVSIVLFTSDKGLCGAFNNSLIRTFERVVGIRPMDATTEARTGFVELRSRVDGGIRYTVHFAGRRGYDAFRTKISGTGIVGEWYQDAVAKPSLANARPIADQLIQEYLDGKTDEIWVVNNRFQSALTQTPQAIKVFPTKTESVKSSNSPILFDPPPGDRPLQADPAVHPLPDPERAPRKRRRRTGRAHDRHGQRHAQRPGNDRQEHPPEEPGSPGPDHDRTCRDHRRRRIHPLKGTQPT
jgi:F-type H+-transporting ATPase subunit gamma